MASRYRWPIDANSSAAAVTIQICAHMTQRLDYLRDCCLLSFRRTRSGFSPRARIARLKTVRRSASCFWVRTFSHHDRPCERVRKMGRVILRTWSGMSSPKLFSKSRSYPPLSGMITRNSERRNSEHTASRGRIGSIVHRPRPFELPPRREWRTWPSFTRRPRKGPTLTGLSGIAICFV